MSAIASPRPRASIETRNARLGVLLIAPTVLILGAIIVYPLSVSYTHLDVYKRQLLIRT